jgi:hypothetical protein
MAHRARRIDELALCHMQQVIIGRTKGPLDQCLALYIVHVPRIQATCGFQAVWGGGKRQAR